MDWFQIIINCIVFIGTAVVVIVGLWLAYAIPVMLLWFVAGFFYNIIRFSYHSCQAATKLQIIYSSHHLEKVLTAAKLKYRNNTN